MSKYIYLRRSVSVWDHKPTLEEIKAKADPDKDPVFRVLPIDQARAYLEISGAKISYSGVLDSKIYASEILYYTIGDIKIFSTSADVESVSIL